MATDFPTVLVVNDREWTRVTENPVMYWRVWSTNYGSNRYGPCEVCGKGADTVCCLDFRAAFDDDGETRLTSHDAPPSVWGHRACLERIGTGGVS